MIEVETEVGEGLEEEIPADEVLAVAEETLEGEKCTTLPAPSAERIVRFRFGQMKTGRSTVATVLKKGETKTEIPENQEEETSEGHIRVVATEEIHAVMTADKLRIS